MSALTTNQVGGLTTGQAANFLFHEGRLLDELRLEEWLDLFAPDSLYWLPIDDNAGRRDTALIYDGDIRRRERVFRLLKTPLPSQTPPSRTLHQISNVIVEPGDDENAATVLSNQVIVEVRTGDHTQRGLGNQNIFAGHCVHDLVRHEDEWRIKTKTLTLLNRDTAVSNLTFML